MCVSANCIMTSRIDIELREREADNIREHERLDSHQRSHSRLDPIDGGALLDDSSSGERWMIHWLDLASILMLDYLF